MATIYVTDRGYAVFSPDGRYLGTWTTLQGATSAPAVEGATITRCPQSGQRIKDAPSADAGVSATPYFDYLIRRKEDPHGSQRDPQANGLGAHA